MCVLDLLSDGEREKKRPLNALTFRRQCSSVLKCGSLLFGYLGTCRHINSAYLPSVGAHCYNIDILAPILLGNISLITKAGCDGAKFGLSEKTRNPKYSLKHTQIHTNISRKKVQYNSRKGLKLTNTKEKKQFKMGRNRNNMCAAHSYNIYCKCFKVKKLKRWRAGNRRKWP